MDITPAQLLSTAHTLKKIDPHRAKEMEETAKQLGASSSPEVKAKASELAKEAREIIYGYMRAGEIAAKFSLKSVLTKEEEKEWLEEIDDILNIQKEIGVSPEDVELARQSIEEVFKRGTQEQKAEVLRMFHHSWKTLIPKKK